MKYSVVWRPFAQHQLATIWLRAADRQSVTDASDEIDRHLRRDADQIGTPDERGWRILVVPPLVATFEVSVADCKATVLAVRYNP